MNYLVKLVIVLTMQGGNVNQPVAVMPVQECLARMAVINANTSPYVSAYCVRVKPRVTHEYKKDMKK